MGAINIKHTGSGSDVALSSDGTSLLLDGTAIGGGGGSDPDLYRDNASSATTPSATGTNAVAIGTDSVSSGSSSMAIGQNTNAANTRAVVLGGYSQAYGINSAAIGFSSTVNSNATDSSALGTRAQVGSNATGATAIGKSYASGNYSFAAAIENNGSSYGSTATNSMAIGKNAKATGNHNIALGGTSQATGSDYSVAIGYMAKSNNHSSVAIGREAGASGLGTSSIAIGHEVHTSSAGQAIAIGKSSIANGWYSVALGNHARTNGIQGKFAYSCDYINNGGDAQTGMYVLHASTTDATATALTTTGTSAGSNNQLIVQNNSAYAFHGTIVAREKASEGTDCAAWKVEGLIRREGSAGTTVLVNSATTVLDNTPNWGMALSADTTNGCLKVAVTGAASTNIRWVGTIHTSELTYA